MKEFEVLKFKIWTHTDIHVWDQIKPTHYSFMVRSRFNLFDNSVILLKEVLLDVVY